MHVYLTESARGFAESDIGREVVEYSFNDRVSTHGRIEAENHSIDDSGWIWLEAVRTDPDNSQPNSPKRIRVSLPPHAVSGVTSVTRLSR
ncbi:hypothetical protein C5E46_35410 [Nocardia nova]|nr:hypothetical protein C5E46_35410 [Nocardia nova]